MSVEQLAGMPRFDTRLESSSRTMTIKYQLEFAGSTSAHFLRITMRFIQSVFSLVAFLATFVAAISIVQIGNAQLTTGWKAHDLKLTQPTVVTPSEKIGGAPDDAIVLFDGTDMTKWVGRNGNEAKWKIVDGAMESVPKSGFVFSKEKFGDCQVHLEFASPAKVRGTGQGRGNSGVFLMGEFEIQVLDSFENETYADGGAGSIYGQYPPLVNASRGPGEWQAYDIIFRRPRFDEDGKVVEKARATVLHNGVLIQDASPIFGPTNWIQHHDYKKMNGKVEGPLSLQDHGNPVRYRNIWVRKLPESRAKPEQQYDEGKMALDKSVAQKLVGKYGGHKVTLDGDAFVLRFNGNTPLEMVPLAKHKYAFTKTAGVVTFEVDESGNPIGFELSLDAAGTRKSKKE